MTMKTQKTIKSKKELLFISDSTGLVFTKYKGECQNEIYSSGGVEVEKDFSNVSDYQRTLFYSDIIEKKYDPYTGDQDYEQKDFKVIPITDENGKREFEWDNHD